MLTRLRRRAAQVLDRRFAALSRDLAAAHAQTARELAAIREEQRAMHEELAALRAEVAAGQLEASGVLRAVASEEPRNRRRLERARRQPSYAKAFTARRPLVSVCIPTVDRVDLLVSRALPSVLNQSYERLEVLVVGDAAPPQVGEAVRAIGDPRIRYLNLTHRVDHGDGERHRLAGSVQARNLAYAEARGAWLSDFDDDDELRPQAIEHAVAFARAERFEAVYGGLRVVGPDGETTIGEVFPPRLGQFGWQGGLVHRGLRFFAREHVSAAYGLPNDWERAERMLRAGVRFGRLDEVVADLYPSRLWRRPPL